MAVWIQVSQRSSVSWTPSPFHSLTDQHSPCREKQISTSTRAQLHTFPRATPAASAKARLQAENSPGCHPQSTLTAFAFLFCLWSVATAAQSVNSISHHPYSSIILTTSMHKVKDRFLRLQCRKQERDASSPAICLQESVFTCVSMLLLSILNQQSLRDKDLLHWWRKKKINKK